jgi:hypothetical protein
MTKEDIDNALENSIPYGYIGHCCSNEKQGSIYIIEEHGISICKMSWYNDNSNIIYLDLLSVNSDSRNKGIATDLQRISEYIGHYLGANTSCLTVEKQTWMHDWYKRIGYVDWKDNENDSDWILMKKYIK